MKALLFNTCSSKLLFDKVIKSRDAPGTGTDFAWYPANLKTGSRIKVLIYYLFCLSHSMRNFVEATVTTILSTRYTASRGSRDLFPVGWCACNQIPLIGQSGQESTVSEEALNSCPVSEPGANEQQLSCRSLEEKADSLEKKVDSLEAMRQDVPGPRTGLTGTNTVSIKTRVIRNSRHFPLNII